MDYLYRVTPVVTQLGPRTVLSQLITTLYSRLVQEARGTFSYPFTHPP